MLVRIVLSLCLPIVTSRLRLLEARGGCLETPANREGREAASNLSQPIVHCGCRIHDRCGRIGPGDKVPPGSACCYGSVAGPPAFFGVGVTARAASMNDGLSEGEELWHLKAQHNAGVVSAYK